ncbi:MAG: redox-sensing transcriptional repressor Rex [Deltaproteobacteria bacterium]|nr:redox-sensing transcriptional repressor Rex [Deltaproteobacteria bacterium]MBW2137617.1 redox-sensing transcriptional repressor Rex [Deltaproteobacteria bacterium]
MKETKIPDATIRRISQYSRPLERLLGQGVRVVSSEKLADLCKVNPAQVRKDLSYFGEFGVRGIGYDVRELLREIERILVSDKEWNLCIVGLGNLGMALIGHENFKKRGYRFVAAFDNDPRKIGLHLPTGHVIQPITKIPDLIQDLDIEIGVITTPPLAAQATADLLMESGIKAILNFAPIQVRQPECCLVENVDFTVSLDNLAYHLGKDDSSL